jgi:peptidoglycan/xylan/chitin deacetylase (PgdA/CDA1 family)
MEKWVMISLIGVLLFGLAVAIFVIFFDQAILVRKGTIYRINNGGKKLVALTFDDGPSPVWTPQILEELRKAGVKATFFMIGRHVRSYPEIARRVVQEGHEVANHTYNHNVLVYFKDEELEKEIRDTESAIKEVTGQVTRYFRPPKAWLTGREKKKIKKMGYEIVLWSLNSKDWVTFDDKYIIRYLVRNIRPGDIILFHDSGGAFSIEGGDRHETVLTIPRLVEKLGQQGYRFVTITELLENGVQ